MADAMTPVAGVRRRVFKARWPVASGRLISLGLMAAAVMLSAPVSLADDTLAQGKKIFTQQAQPSCTACHTLADAGSQGQIGPNLDQLQPGEDRVYAAVTSGVGVMPPYDGLSDPERRAVARYVAAATGKDQ